MCYLNTEQIIKLMSRHTAAIIREIRLKPEAQHITRHKIRIVFVLSFLCRSICNSHRQLVTPRGCKWIRPILTPIQYMVPWTRKSQPSKQHLDRFSRFCTVHSCDPHTDTLTHTDHATYVISRKDTSHTTLTFVHIGITMKQIDAA